MAGPGAGWGDRRGLRSQRLARVTNEVPMGHWTLPRVLEPFAGLRSPKRLPAGPSETLATEAVGGLLVMEPRRSVSERLRGNLLSHSREPGWAERP